MHAERSVEWEAVEQYFHTLRYPEWKGSVEEIVIQMG